MPVLMCALIVQEIRGEVGVRGKGAEMKVLNLLERPCTRSTCVVRLLLSRWRFSPFFFRLISNVFLEKESQKIHLCQSLAKTTLSTTCFVRCIGRHLSSDSPGQDLTFITPRSAWLPSHLSNRDFFFLSTGLEERRLAQADGRKPDLSLGLGAEGLLRRSQQDKPKIWERGFGRKGWKWRSQKVHPWGGRVSFWLLPPTPPAISAGAQLTLVG